MDETTLSITLWGAAVLLLGWTWLPALISGLGGTRYANGGSDDPTAAEPAADDAGYGFWRRQLAALGYEPLGPAWMRITFHGPDWRHESVVRTFYSRARQTFAFVQKQPRPMDVWWLTMFATVWQDGGMLLTNNAVDEAPGDGEYVVQGMDSTDLAAVETLHLGQKERMEATGRRADRDGSLDTLLRAAERHAGPATRQLGARLGQTYLATHGAIHLFLSTPVAYTLGLGHWAVPTVNLVLGTIIGASDYMARRRAAALMRAQLAGTAADAPGQS